MKPVVNSVQPSLAILGVAMTNYFLPFDGVDLIAVVPAQLLTCRHELHAKEGDRVKPESKPVTTQYLLGPRSDLRS